MIVRCHHLREAGIITCECCLHCHLLAGCCFYELSEEHTAIFCCACTGEFTAEEVQKLLARIPEWEKREEHLSTPLAVSKIPLVFRRAYEALQRFEGDEQYLAALIVGPIPLQKTTRRGEMEVQVIVRDDVFGSEPTSNSCVIEDISVSLTFLSWQQWEDKLWWEIERRGHRYPLALTTSIIVFDKKGVLQRMQDEARRYGHP